MKICFVASSGGHWEELMCLREIADAYDSFFVTEKGGQANDSHINRIYTLPQINRSEKAFVWHFVKLFFTAFFILKKEKPKVIITTGALIAYPFCLLTKLFGGKVIYIESFARVDNASLTGRLVYSIADLFLVQWQSMLRVYPKAKYVGGIF
jgi:UDP-N-acetylglucosamine:LPS N-acetylglucosamine transferase